MNNVQKGFQVLSKRLSKIELRDTVIKIVKSIFKTFYRRLHFRDTV